jgi:hypothetical protein
MRWPFPRPVFAAIIATAILGFLHRHDPLPTALADGASAPIAAPQIGRGSAMSFPPQTGGGGSFSATWEANMQANAGFAGTYSFTSVPTGTASPGRIIEVEVDTDTGAISSVSICGATTTQDVIDSSSQFGAWHANVTTGTTCTITINSSLLYDIGISVWSITGATGGGSASPSVATAVDSPNTAEPVGFTYTVGSSNVALLSMFCPYATAATMTWTVASPVGTNTWGAAGRTPVLGDAQDTAAHTATVATPAGVCAFGGGLEINVSF